MTFRIQRAASGDATVFMISGEIAEGHEADLRPLLDAVAARNAVLDLAELTVVDRGGVLLLAGYEARGAVLANCPGYVRAWIDKEQQETCMTIARESVAREDTFVGTGGLRIFYRGWRPADAARAV